MSTIARDGLTGGAVAASGTGAGSVALAGAVTRGAVGLAVLRVVLGIVFAAHGAQKVFVMGIPGLAESFAAVGVPLAGIAAPAVALLELVGGLALIGGLFVTPIALGLTAVMIGALFLVHLAAGFFLPNGYEFVLTLGAGAVALALAGPGAWSLDGVLAKRRVAKQAEGRRL
jgi:putative oxidoreductase